MGSVLKSELKLPLAGYGRARPGHVSGSNPFYTILPMLFLWGGWYHGIWYWRPSGDMQNTKKCEKSKMAETKYLSPKPNIKEVSLSGPWVGIEPYTNALGGLVKGSRGVWSHLKFSCVMILLYGAIL